MSALLQPVDGWPAPDTPTPDPHTAGPAAPGTDPLSMDLHSRAVSVSGQQVTLTAREYRLLELLFTARGRLFGRDDILERLWGLDFGGDARIVDTYVKRLRAKLGPGAVETVRGLGYRCPLPESTGVPQPHLDRLPPEARLLTRLAQRILQVTEAQHIITDVYALTREYCGALGLSLWGVSLWALPVLRPPAVGSPGAGPPMTLLAHAGQQGPPPLGLHDQPGLAVVPLGSGIAGEGPWALLSFAAPQGHLEPDTRSALDAVAGLVNPALRLNAEIHRRRQAEDEVRRLNDALERRVQARTRELAQANAGLTALYDLAQQLAGAGSLQDVLSRGLTRLAQLVDAVVCSLWRLRVGELRCVAAYSPAHHDRTAALQQEAAHLASALRQSVACTPEGGLLTRTATLPGNRQVLLVPVAPGLAAISVPEVHALHLELRSAVPDDLSLLDAAARAFGLALERQVNLELLEQVALSDELTGLPNRRALLSDLGAELSYAQRHRSVLTLSLLEIADIREVNRQQGFAGGNDLIRALSTELHRTLRAEDRVYRLGGALLACLSRSAGTAEAHALQGRLMRLAGQFGAEVPGGGILRVSCVQAPGDTTELSELLHLGLHRLEAQ